MPVAAKEIHLADNLKDLKNKCVIDLSKIKDKSFPRLISSAKKLYEAAKKELDEVQPDEELTYMYLFRAMDLWQYIMKLPECFSDKKYFELMHGKDIKEIMRMLEEYTLKLEKRYAALENGTVYNKKETLQAQFKLANGVNPKKRKEGKDSINEISNGIKSPMNVDQKCHDDLTLILNTNADVSRPKKEYYEVKKFMDCDVLKEKINGSALDILVIDIRPKEDFELSRINSVHSVNIPGPLITAGLSANKLGKLISNEDKNWCWGQRDQYEQVVLLDWHSEEKDVIPGSPLSNLYISLTKWDPDCIYKNNPLILNGGFERFFDAYPMFTTNPKIKCPEKPISSPFIHLSDQDIEYPMNILEEDKSDLNSKTVYNKGDTDLISSTSSPSIDRSTKPHQLVKKIDKPDNILKNILPSERSVSVTQNPNQIAYEEKMEEEKVIEPTSTQNGELPPEHRTTVATDQSKERMSEKRNSHIPSSIPPRPVTPPRPEKHTVLSNKDTVVGDGDGETYLERTKFNTPNRPGGGLKRSASSPNINKLGDEEMDKSSWAPPSFDRNTKPTSYSDYMPRSAGTDTVYQADSNRKGRGLTGLKNLGNLCYMNSIMQCISHTEQLNKELTKFNPNECRNGRQIASEVSSLLRTLWQGDTRITSCRNLKTRVGALRHSFSTMEQQDSHEFLTILVDWLHEDLNEPSNILSLEGAKVSTGEKAWGEFRRKNNSPVLNLFYGQLKSTVTCDYCQTESVAFEPFSNLSIPLPSSQDDKDRTFNLQECLKLYLKGESISGWVCPNCKTARKATKKLDITRLPPVLIIHLKRFMNDMVGVGWCRKRMNMVDFPINDLDMKPFTHPESELRFHNYNLYAVSNHYGSMESGHYTAYCKNHILNKWYKFDDQDVGEISPSEVKSSAAYILFYESCQFESQSQRILD